MPVSAVVDTVIGLSFAFFVLSLAASAIAEWVATVLRKRSKYLLRGLRAMLEGTPEDVDGGATRFWTAAHAERAITKEALRVLDGTRPSAADGGAAAAPSAHRRAGPAARGRLGDAPAVLPRGIHGRGGRARR